MKGGIKLVLVLFASISIGDVDAIQCYKCDGQSKNKFLDYVCHGDDLGELVECTGHCMKMIQPKTGEVFLTKDSELACTTDIDCQLIPKFLTICSY